MMLQIWRNQDLDEEKPFKKMCVLVPCVFVITGFVPSDALTEELLTDNNVPMNMHMQYLKAKSLVPSQ